MSRRYAQNASRLSWVLFWHSGGIQVVFEGIRVPFLGIRDLALLASLIFHGDLET